MSFALTTKQFRNGTKTVTRRLGWRNLKAGDLFCAVVKGMGLKKGEKVERLGVCRVVSVRQEQLDAITNADVIEEGFPNMTALEFVLMFCEHHVGCEPTTVITRIEFERDRALDFGCDEMMCRPEDDPMTKEKA